MWDSEFKAYILSRTVSALFRTLRQELRLEALLLFGENCSGYRILPPQDWGGGVTGDCVKYPCGLGCVTSCWCEATLSRYVEIENN